MIFRHTLIFAAAMSSAFVAADNTRRARSLGVRGSIHYHHNNKEKNRDLEEQYGEWTLTCQDNPMAYGTDGTKDCKALFQSYNPRGEPYTDDRKTEVCNLEYNYDVSVPKGSTETVSRSAKDPNNSRVLRDQTHEIGVEIWKICQKKCAPYFENLPCCPNKDATTTFQIQKEYEDCNWVAKGSDNRTRQECKKNSGDILVSKQCPVACGEVDEGICAKTSSCDVPEKFAIHIQKDCEWVGKGNDTRTISKCQMISGNDKVSDQCPETCDKVGEGSCAFLKP